MFRFLKFFELTDIAYKRCQLTSSLEVLDDDDMQEIKKIQQMLNPNEEVLVVERQSRQNIASDIIMKNFISTSFYD